MKNPRLLQTTKTMLATVALTGLMAGSAARLHASTTGTPDQYSSAKGLFAADSDAGKHDCKGKNTCKGQGGCKTGDAGCKGQNTCKGKGGCKTNGTTRSVSLAWDEGLVFRPLVLTPFLFQKNPTKLILRQAQDQRDAGPSNNRFPAAPNWMQRHVARQGIDSRQLLS